MTRYLVIETSSQLQRFGIVEEGALVNSFDWAPSHPKGVMESVQRMVAECPCDGIVFGRGPGSYTGLRIGYAIAQGLQFAWECPLLGACSLAAFGEGVVVSDARSGGVYVWDGDKAAQMQPQELDCQKVLIPSHQLELKEKLAPFVREIGVAECDLSRLVLQAEQTSTPIYLRGCSAVVRRD